MKSDTRRLSDNITQGTLGHKHVTHGITTSLSCLQSHSHFSVSQTLRPHLEAGLAIEGHSSALR